MSTAFPNQRILPIDIFRGLTILVMIFVNELSGVGGIPMWAKHMPADADTMTFVDIVFPAFLFIVGMSMPFAIQIRHARGASMIDILQHSLIRGLSLILIGFYMVNTIWGWDEKKMPFSIQVWKLIMYSAFMMIWAYYPKHINPIIKNGFKAFGIFLLALLWYLYEGVDNQGMTTQWWGILGLIGWAYMMALPIYLLSKKVSILAVFSCLYYAAFVLLDNMPDSENVIIGWLIENKRNTTHAALVLMGCMLSVLNYHEHHAARRRINSVIYFVTTMVFAFLSWQISPISKIWATPPWALFSIASCIALFLSIQWVIEEKKATKWTKFIEPAADNALLIYMLPNILIAIFAILNLSIRPDIFNSGLPGAAWTLAFSLAMVYLGGVLNKIGFKLKL